MLVLVLILDVLLFQIEDTGPDMHGLHPFTITYSNKHMVVAVASEEEKYKWMEVGYHDNLVNNAYMVTSLKTTKPRRQ